MEMFCKKSVWYKKDAKGSPLHQAVSNRKYDIVKVLVSLGANLQVTDDEGKTPLHILEEMCRQEAWYTKDAKSDSPLHQAASQGQIEMTVSLVSLGANLLAKNNEAMTPYELAEVTYKRRKDSFFTFRYQKTLEHLKEKMNTLIDTDKESTVNGNNETIASNKTRSTYTDMSKPDTKKDIQLPWLVGTREFQRMLSHGEYLSYENRLSLGGPCKAGKSTLASMLIGEDIPLQWNSTDGLVIYFGRNGIDIEKKKMVPLRKGERGHEVLAKILRGDPNICEKSKQENGLKTTKINETKQTGKMDMIKSAFSSIFSLDVYKATDSLTDRYASPSSLSMTESVVKCNCHSTLNEGITPATLQIQTLDIQKLQLQTDILEEVRNGKYRIEIAPSDLIDFGGQKSYDMTHQLFIQHSGSFVLMFDCRFGLHTKLDEYQEGLTAASILKHWVDSILTYTEDTEDIMPMILFAATHRDMCKEDTTMVKETFIRDIKQMFSGHEKKNHIHFDTVYFINSRDKNDAEIQQLTDQIVYFAMRQSSWGQRRPMQWVPLELQISKMRIQNLNIISKKDLQHVNLLNEDLALNERQLDEFLLVQHSFGKLMYYNLPRLDEFIIIHPPALVNILRSFVTDEKFFPTDKHLKYILQGMTDTGKIYKTDLLKIWKQDYFHQYMPNDIIKEFVLQLLVHLDILIIPKCLKLNSPFSDMYIVPCTIKAKNQSNFYFLDNQKEKTICLRYILFSHSIPTSLAYKLIGATINVWPLKDESHKPCIYHKAAVLNVTEDNELRISIDNNQVMVYITNQISLLSISPDVAASVQECLTRILESCLLFHYNSFGRKLKATKVSELYTMELGIQCGSDVCFRSSREVIKIDNWICGKGKEHETRYLRYWLFYKTKKTCSHVCDGLTFNELRTEPSDKHLVRLGSLIGIKSFEEFYIHLGMEKREWESTEYTFAGHSSEGIMSMALKHWKESKLAKLKRPTLQNLSDALTAVELDSHLLCQIFRENTEFLEIADLNLQVIPSDKHLKELSNKIGNCPLQLGIELGLSFTEVEQSLFSFTKDLPCLVEDILAKWKRKSKVKTLHCLMMALERVNAGGVSYLLLSCNWVFYYTDTALQISLCCICILYR
ncbi:uncharacterized protein LOC143050853 [Mytilus galloprovincialis]|uniref:uncharacterized protein LOC143050853 n=1 Tax=Mytilus galloprovincialis TaxID=29158 RepID=UPI003F7C32FC